AIRSDQDVVFDLLEGKSSMDELNEHDRVRVFNSLQSINAAIANKEDERVVCVRERRVGSNMVERVCRSRAEMRRQRDAARKELQDGRGICNSSACSER
ncbi:MAG TPA: hypothetical protein VHF86_04555, partial [Xanthomonadaceae bacterium]|nr:hypothetical protein [Xanthomonadaceae bacterium]